MFKNIILLFFTLTLVSCWEIIQPTLDTFQAEKDVFESGKSLTIGFDYKKENSVDSINKYFELKLAKVLRDNDENFIPELIKELLLENQHRVTLTLRPDQELARKKVEAEQHMLDMAFEPKKLSRLSCQITVDESLDGLVVKMPSKQG